MAQAHASRPHATTSPTPQVQADDEFSKVITPFVAQNCSLCHNEKLKTAGLSLVGYSSTDAMLKDRAEWEKVVAKLQAGEMPPKGMPQPTPDAVKTVVSWLQDQFALADKNAKPDPGHLVAHRLNRAEYNNTVRDLLAVNFKPSSGFPADDSGYGFDNIGDVLTVSPVLTEKYLAAAEQIAVDAIPTIKPQAQVPESYKRIFICGHPPGEHTKECARTDLAHLAQLAYRRPVTAEEVKQLTRLVARARHDGLPFDQAMRIGVEAILCSPNFLFRIEHDPSPSDPTPHPIGDYELASRLSYFLWSSMPDAELFAAAEQHRLNTPQVLNAQVLRMLKDPRAAALVDNFAGQWLEFRNISLIHPDKKSFPAYTPALRKDMVTETRMFVQGIIQDDRSILDFIDGAYSYMNEDLAKFYGIQGVTGPEFRKVSLAGTERSGVLTQASVLTVTSYPTRTSPVLRGKWILENFLNAPPPPPPPGVGSLDTKGASVTGTMRQQMERHRADPLCAGCHTRMDPLGFALENYNAIGQWRDKEGAFPIDASGSMPNGTKFNGSSELKTYLKSKPEAFASCLTEKLMTYALGRGIEPYDQLAERKIVQNLGQQDYRFSALVLGIVDSMPFRMGRGDLGSPQEGSSE
ncbi:MAG: DUF1592 domain-containing protein [Bryobacteraceae bacterium]